MFNYGNISEYPGAVNNFVNKELTNWNIDKDNVFRRQHVRMIERAIYYKLPYNLDTYEIYKDEIGEFIP